jgi:hypothetical protein
MAALAPTLVVLPPHLGTVVLSVLLVSLLLAAVPDSAPQIHLDARDLPSCFNRARLRYALETQLGEQILGGDPLTSPLLTVGLPSPDALSVALVDSSGALLGERALEITPARCPQLPRTIALMVDAWLHSIPSPLLPDPESPSLRASEGRVDSPVETASRDTEPKKQGPTSLTPPTPPEASPASAASLALAPPAPKPEPRLDLSLSLLAGGQVLGNAKSGGYHGAAALSLSNSGGWGVAAVSSFDSAVAFRDSPGRIECSAQSLDLLLELRSAVGEPTSFSFLIGPSVQRLAAVSEGFTTSGSATRYDFGAAALGQWEQQLVSRLSLVLAVRAGLRLHDDTFRVDYSDGKSATLEVSSLRLSASAGLSWRIF